MEKPIIKDKESLKYIEYLEKRLEVYEHSPYYKTYLTLKSQIDSFNEQLTLRTEKVTVEGNSVELSAGFVDLFADKDDKSFDRTKWYFDNMLSLNKQLDDIRKLMTPNDQKELKEKEKLQNAGLAEKIALGIEVK